MLEDRDYMREPDYGQSRWRQNFHLRWTWTNTLIAAYVVVLIIQQVGVAVFDTTKHHPVNEFITEYLALSKAGLTAGYVWQLATYQFLHVGWLHLILNSWAIFVFGNELERILGGRRFLTLMFSSGIVGGIFQMILAMLWARFDDPVVGASAAAFGLVAAFAMLFPERELTMLLFFVIPVQLRAKMLLLISVVVALVGMVVAYFASGHDIVSGQVAHAAHLGGMAMGCFYAKMILNRALLGVDEQEPPFRPAPAKAADQSPDVVPEEDVDAVLDKISARGINSLTSRERAILEAARKKMAQR